MKEISDKNAKNAKKRNYAPMKAILALALSALAALSAWPLICPPNVSADAGQSQLAVANSPSYDIDPQNGGGPDYWPVGNVPGEFEDGRFILEDTGGHRYLAFCADKLLQAPEVDGSELHNYYGGVTEVQALAAALASAGYGAKLSLDEFNKLFGVTLGQEQDRLMIMTCFLWTDRLGVTDPNPANWPGAAATPTDLTDLKTKLGATYNYYAEYEMIAAGLRAMAAEYAKPASSPGISDISSNYDPSTGLFAFTHGGYAGSGAAPAFALVVAGADMVEVNGSIFTGATVTIQNIFPGDTIYIYGGTNLDMTVSQISPLVLKKGSIKGDLFENITKPSNQHILTGYAEFGNLSSKITAANGAATYSATVGLKKAFTIQPNSAPGAASFGFTVRGVNNSGAVITQANNAGYKNDQLSVGFNAAQTEDFSFAAAGLAPGIYYYKVTETLTAAQINDGWSITNGENTIWIQIEVHSDGAIDIYYAKNQNFPSSWFLGTTASDSVKTFNNQFTVPVHKETITYFKAVTKSASGAFSGDAAFQLAITRVDGDSAGAAPIMDGSGNYVHREVKTVSLNGAGNLSGAVDFSNFVLEEGTYYYKISEVPGSLPGWIYDETFYIAKIVVSASGQVITLTKYQGGKAPGAALSVKDIAFANHYIYGDFEVEASKAVFGAFAGSSPVFDFTLQEVDANGDSIGNIPLDSKSVGPVSRNNPQSAAFSVANVPVGTHYYVIGESIPSPVPDNWVYDAKKMIVKVVVDYGAAISGTNDRYLSVTVDYPCETAPFWNAQDYKSANDGTVFTNNYTSASARIYFTKEVYGRRSAGFPADKQFAFVVEEVDINGDLLAAPSGCLPGGLGAYEILSAKFGPNASNDSTSQTIDVLLGNLSEGDYYFKITEKDESVAGDGWTYDNEALYLKLEVAKNANGVTFSDPVVSVFDINNSKTSGIFANTYHKATAALSFSKAYYSPDGNYFPPNNPFSYTLTRLFGNGDNPTQMSNTSDTETMTSVNAGEKIFDGAGGGDTSSIKRGVAMLSELLPGSYYFSISEAPNATNGMNGWTHSIETLYAKVTIQAGTNAPAVEWWDKSASAWASGGSSGDSSRTITNTYIPANKGHAAVYLGGIKTLEINAANPGNPQFSFKLTELEGPDPNKIKSGGIVSFADTPGSVNGDLFRFPMLVLPVNMASPQGIDYYFKIEEDFTGITDWASEPIVYVLTVRVWASPVVEEVIEVTKYINGTAATSHYGSKVYPNEPLFSYDEIAFANVFPGTPPTGKVTAKKEFNPAGDAPADGSSYTLVLKQGGNLKYAFTLSASNNWQMEIADVDPGVYDVEEINMPAGYRAYSMSHSKITVTDGADLVVTAVNEKIPPPLPPAGKVTAKKAFDPAGDAPDATDKKEFTVVLKQGGDVKYMFTLSAANNWQMELLNVNPGIYDVEEVDMPDGYEKVSLLPEQISVVDGGDATVTATNKKIPETPIYPLGKTSVTAKKEFNPASDAPTDATAFKLALKQGGDVKYAFTLSASNNWQMEIADVDPGVYDVEEVDIPGGYEKVSLSHSRITVANGDALTVTATNKKAPPPAPPIYPPVLPATQPTTALQTTTQPTTQQQSSEKSTTLQLPDAEPKTAATAALDTEEPITIEAAPQETGLVERGDESAADGGSETEEGEDGTQAKEETEAPPPIQYMTQPTIELEEFEEVEDRTPLGNGWWAEYDKEEGIWYIFDENGIPIGYIMLPDGENIEEYDVAGNLIPLFGFWPDEKDSDFGAKPNPGTGDAFLAVLLGSVLALALCIAAISRMRKKKAN